MLAPWEHEPALAYGPAFPPGYRATRAELTWALEALRFHPLLVHEAERFIRESLPRPFVAVHLRMWDNINCLNYPNSSDANCFPSNENLDQAMARARSVLEYASVFLATDGTRFSRDWHMIEEHHARVYEQPLLRKAAHSAFAAVVDMLICTEADLFIGTIHSSFSLHIQQMRAILGRHSPHDDVIVRDSRIKWLFDDWWRM